MRKRLAYRLSTLTALVAASLCLTSCSGGSGLVRNATTAEKPQVEAFVLPAPGGPQVIAVSERYYSNAVEQTISLATTSSVSGQNYIRARLFGPVGAEGGQTALGFAPLGATNLSREARTAVSGVAMSRSPLYVQNSYGPFGYSIGRSGSDTCLFAWQRLSNSKPVPLVYSGVVEIRLRLCATDTSEAELLAVMYGLTVNTSFAGPGWNPLGRPASADERLGQTGTPIYPVGANGVETVLPASTVVARGPAVPNRARAVAAVPAVQQPAVPANAPLVPPPPVSAPSDKPVVPAP